MADRAFNSYPGAPSIAGNETLLIAQGGVTLNTTPDQILQAGLVPTFGDTTVRNLIFTANQSVSNVLAAPTATPGIPVWRQLSTDDIGGMGVFFSSPPPIGDITPNTGAFTALSGLVTATGSPTARTLADRAADWVNVKDFGAKLDGITNDRAAFSASRAAVTKNGTILVPSGGYSVTGSITGGPSTPVLWRLTGNSFGTGTTPVNGIGTDTVESFFNGAKYFGRLHTVADMAPVASIVLNSDHTGGTTGNTMSGLLVTSNVSNNPSNYVWALTSVANVTATGGGQHLAIAGYVNRNTSSGGAPVWAMNLVATDQSGLGSDANNPLVSAEIDIHADGSDSYGVASALIPANSGKRVILDVIGSRYGSTGTTEIGYAVRAGAHSQGLQPVGPWATDKAYALRVFTAIGGFSIAAYDASLATAMGNANAFRMASDQTFAFDGTTNSRTLGYVTADTALEYKVGGTTRWSVSDAGVMSASALATGGTTARTLAAIFADQNNVKSFGAVGDGTTVDLAALLATPSPAALPSGIFYTGATIFGITGSLRLAGGVGSGQIKTVEGGTDTLQARNVSIIRSPRTVGGTGFNRAFSGDTSLVHMPWQTFITGATTLGQPTSGYVLNNNVSGVLGYMTIDTTAGFNNGTGSAGNGRTGAFMNSLYLSHAGNGDGGTNYLSVFVSGAKAGATSFLANPAGSIVAGQVLAGANGVYLQPLGDINTNDGGFDVTGIGAVLNMNRTNGTGALGATWIGVRVQQSPGVTSVPIDAAFSFGGASKAKVGLDFSSADFATSGTYAAVALRPAQRIYGNVTNSGPFPIDSTLSLGTEWLSYETATGWGFVVGSASVFNVNVTAVTASKNLIRKAATADQSADVYVATAAGSRTIPDGCSWECLTPSATIATFTTTMPANPLDKQEVWISTTQTITTWTLSPNTGQTINGAPTTLGANTSVQFRYNLATTTWFRML